MGSGGVERGFGWLGDGEASLENRPKRVDRCGTHFEKQQSGAGGREGDVENGGAGGEDDGEVARGGAGSNGGEEFEEGGFVGGGGELGGELAAGGAGGFGQGSSELEIEFLVDFDQLAASDFGNGEGGF